MDGGCSIAHRLYDDVVHGAHFEYMWRCRRAIENYEDTRPRIDTGEGLIYLEEELEKIYQEECSEAGFTLTKAKIDLENWPITCVLPDYTIEYPWEKGDKETT